MRNKFIVIGGFLVFVLAGIAASKKDPGTERNLKVLPKDIIDADIDSVMEGFVSALNVGCDFYHSKSKTNFDALDFARDDKPEKEITRQMMRMAEMINKEFFGYTIVYKAGETMAVTCNTCHGGYPRPELKNEKKQ